MSFIIRWLDVISTASVSVKVMKFSMGHSLNFQHLHWKIQSLIVAFQKSYSEQNTTSILLVGLHERLGYLCACACTNAILQQLFRACRAFQSRSIHHKPKPKDKFTTIQAHHCHHSKMEHVLTFGENGVKQKSAALRDGYGRSLRLQSFDQEWQMALKASERLSTCIDRVALLLFVQACRSCMTSTAGG